MPGLPPLQVLSSGFTVVVAEVFKIGVNHIVVNRTWFQIIFVRHGAFSVLGCSIDCFTKLHGSFSQRLGLGFDILKVLTLSRLFQGF